MCPDTAQAFLGGRIAQGAERVWASPSNSALQRRASPQFPLTSGLRERGSRPNSVYPSGLSLGGFFSVLGGRGQAARPDVPLSPAE